MAATKKPWMRCPNCEQSLEKEIDNGIYLLEGIGLGCLSEILLFMVTTLLMAVVWSLDFDTAYILAIIIVAFIIGYFLHNHLTYFKCKKCNYTFDVYTLKKKYNKSLKNGTPGTGVP